MLSIWIAHNLSQLLRVLFCLFAWEFQWPIFKVKYYFVWKCIRNAITDWVIASEAVNSGSQFLSHPLSADLSGLWAWLTEAFIMSVQLSRSPNGSLTIGWRAATGRQVKLPACIHLGQQLAYEKIARLDYLPCTLFPPSPLTLAASLSHRFVSVIYPIITRDGHRTFSSPFWGLSLLSLCDYLLICIIKLPAWQVYPVSPWSGPVSPCRALLLCCFVQLHTRHTYSVWSLVMTLTIGCSILFSALYRKRGPLYNW